MYRLSQAEQTDNRPMKKYAPFVHRKCYIGTMRKKQPAAIATQLAQEQAGFGHL